jgi:hypothetical protein
LGLHSENLTGNEATDISAEVKDRIDHQAGDIQAELSVEGAQLQQPDSLDAAVAHVLSAEPILDLIEEVELDTEAGAAGKAALQHGATSGQSESESNPVSPVQAIEAESSGTVVLPEPVLLETVEKTAPVPEAGADKLTAAAAAAKAHDAKAELLMKHRAALAKAEAIKKRKLALARAAVLKQKKMAQSRMSTPIGNIRLQKLLRQYLGKAIGINFDNSAVIEAADLLSVNAEYLTVLVKSRKLRYHFPLTTILSIIESADGNGVPTGADNEVFNAVVKIYPLVLF